jgi:hypothetical protein
MHRSSALLLAAVVAALFGVTGCGSSDDESTSPPPATTSQAASKQPAPDTLDAGDAAVLRQASQTAARYCGHRATAGELTGAVATVESLYQIDPKAKGASGRTVEQTAKALERRLRACGNRSAAKRLAKLTG